VAIDERDAVALPELALALHRCGLQPFTAPGLLEVGEVRFKQERKRARDRCERVVANVEVDVEAVRRGHGELGNYGMVYVFCVARQAWVLVVGKQEVVARRGHLNGKQRLAVETQSKTVQDARVGVVESFDAFVANFTVGGGDEERLVVKDLVASRLTTQAGLFVHSLVARCINGVPTARHRRRGRRPARRPGWPRGWSRATL